PQRYVRLRALREGKVVYMAVPRLRQARCFWELDPRRLRDMRAAASIGGAAKAGRAVDPRELPHLDLVVAGSAAMIPLGCGRERRGRKTRSGVTMRSTRKSCPVSGSAPRTIWRGWTVVATRVESSMHPTARQRAYSRSE